MSRTSRLTALALEKAKPKDKPYYLSDDDGTRGGGRLMLRVMPTGSKLWYYRYSVGGVRRSMPMRPFTPRPEEGSYTLEQARERARAFAELHRREESRDVAAYLAAKSAAKAAASDAAERERAQRETAARATVSALCDRYIAHLQRAGKVSWRDARNIFARYVDTSPFATLPARDLTGRQATEMFRRIVEAGHGRTAAKARSYLRAAYSLAIKAELDATAPADLIGFGIESNPVADTAALTAFNKARDRVLSSAELGALWHHLLNCDLFDEEHRSPRVIALSLLLGGQRVAQLLRARVQDVDFDQKTLTLLDGKGRRTEARRHVLPLVEPALALVRYLADEAARFESDHLFSHHKTVTVPKTVSDAGTAIARALVQAGHIKRLFQVRDLRRTAETMMAAMGVPKEVRAQVQSHGLGGIQDRHYDRHDYMAEKRQALERFATRLDELGRAAAKRGQAS